MYLTAGNLDIYFSP